MPVQAYAREGDWARLVAPVAVLLASVAACSVMPPAGASARMSTCTPEGAMEAVGHTADSPIIERARHASASTTVRVVMPGEYTSQVTQADRLNLFVDGAGRITRATCG